MQHTKREQMQIINVLHQFSLNAKSVDGRTQNNDMIVFSHLRWEFVTQRPQHLISRLATSRKILFVEEPIPFDNYNHGTAEIIKVNPHITVIQPRISSEYLMDELMPLVRDYAQQLQLNNPILWFYSAAFADAIKHLNHSIVVYDCMDELSAFKGAPASLINHEKQLLSTADVVFTGGKSLYEAKQELTDNVHCFPSSVDREHFAKALKKRTRVPSDLAKIGKPVVGFYGVIDERIDFKLLAEVAKLMPEVSFVMLGPVVKIDEADLPHAENIHYLGGKSYTVLPNYLRGFDITMMPFALNNATKFISPTKTLEYMAAHKPIISTAIYDVVRDFKREVSIINNAKEFAAAIKSYLNETITQKKKRVTLQNAVLEKTSWDNTAYAMEKLIYRQLNKLPQHSTNEMEEMVFTNHRGTRSL